MGSNGTRQIVRRWPCGIVALLGLAWLAPAASGMDVTLRLVRSDAPGRLVSTAITPHTQDEAKARQQIEDDAAAWEARLAEATKSAGRKVAAPEAVPETRRHFDRYCNYARGILIDGKYPFHKTYQGKYTGRSDVITLSLEDGEHILEPGAHKFTCERGRISSSDPSLKINGSTIDVIAYPVTLLLFNGNAVRPGAAELFRLEAALRVYSGSELLLPKEDDLSPDTTFRRLTLYVPANTQGAGYRLSPSDVAFYVSAEGVSLPDQPGLPAAASGVRVEDRFTLAVPETVVPILTRGTNIQIMVSGPAGHLKFMTEPMLENPQTLRLLPAPEGSRLVAGRRTMSAPLPIPADLGAFPRRQIIVDAVAPEAAEPRIMSVGLAPNLSAPAGHAVRVRVEFVDAFDAPTVSPMQVAAYVLRTPVLGDDGRLAAAPAGKPAVGDWLPARVAGTTETNQYDVLLPELPSSVYWLRIVMDCRGSCSPASPMQADFVQGIVNSAATPSVSVFCPNGRHAFARGADVPVTVVVRSPASLPAGTLKLTLQKGTQAWPLWSRTLKAQTLPESVQQVVLPASLTLALSASDYRLVAQWNDTISNGWSLRLTEARFREAFPTFGGIWARDVSVDAGCEEWAASAALNEDSMKGNAKSLLADRHANDLNDPVTIAAANEKRLLLSRNAAVLAQQGTLNLTRWGGLRGYGVYEGRAAAGEAAVVEEILRQNPALPAPEVYYGQNHFEAVSEALAAQGLGQVNELYSDIEPGRPVYTDAAEVNARLRQVQLVAQLGSKFENLIGLAPAPLVEPKTGASLYLRGLLLKEFATQFKSTPPLPDPAAQFITSRLAGKQEPWEPAARWETWAALPAVLPERFLASARQAVAVLGTDLTFVSQAPDDNRKVPPVCPRAPGDTVLVTTDPEDSVLFAPFVRTRFLQMEQARCWGVTDLGKEAVYAGGEKNPLASFYAVKNQFAAFLAGGAAGFGCFGQLGIRAQGDDVVKDFGYLPQEIQQQLQDIRELTHLYGDLFQDLRALGDVAVYYPYRQSLYENVNPALGSARMASYDCLLQLAVLGYSGQMLSEAQVERGDLARFKVVVVPLLHYLPKEQQDKLTAFAAGGGTLLVGSGSTLVLPGARRISDDFGGYADAAAQVRAGKWPRLCQLRQWEQLQGKVGALDAAVAPVVTPYARAAGPHVLVQTSRMGDGYCTIVWNSFLSSLGKFVNDEEEEKKAKAASLVPAPQPIQETVSFPAEGVTYDASAQLALPASTNGGRVEAKADLSRTPFRLFVTLPKAPASVKVEAAKQVRAGEMFDLKVTALDAGQKPINACLPIRAALYDAAGRQVWELTGTAKPTLERRVCAPYDVTPGRLRLDVEELVTGLKGSLDVEVVAASAEALSAGVRTPPAIDVATPALLRDFVAARKKDGQTVALVLPVKPNDRRAFAEQAVKALQGLGVKAEIVTLDDNLFTPGARVYLPQSAETCWTDMAPLQFLDRHLVVLGSEGAHLLIDELQQNRLLPRPLSASYPGPGNGVIEVVRSPFAFGRDVLGLFARDDAGLKALIEALPRILEPAPAPVAVPPLPADQVVALTTSLPTTRMSAADGPPVQAVCAAPDGSRIVFGTACHGTNLFTFDLEGKLLTQDKGGLVNSLQLNLSDAGKLVVASDARVVHIRDADGVFRSRIAKASFVDPGGRYFTLRTGRGFAVCDAAFNVLWQLDTLGGNTAEVLFGRGAKFVGSCDHGDTIVYRMSGKAFGTAGEFCDDLIFCDALTGKEKRRVALHMADVFAVAGISETKGTVREFRLAEDGRSALVLLDAFKENKKVWPGAPEPAFGDSILVLLDEQMRPIRRENFTLPTLFGARQRRFLQLLPDRRLLFAVGDTVCLSDAAWQTLATFPAGNIVCSLVADAPRHRIMACDGAGIVTALDFSLRPLWRYEAGSGGRLAVARDGQTALGTFSGQAQLIDAAGKRLWARSLAQDADPAQVAAMWSKLSGVDMSKELKQLNLTGQNEFEMEHRKAERNSIPRAGNEPWWEILEKNVGFRPDIAKLAGPVRTNAPLTALCEASPFGTYVVEWRSRQTKGSAGLVLEIVEIEKGPAGEQQQERVKLPVQPGENERLERTLLRLGDRAAKLRVTVRATGDGEIDSSVKILPLAFPSPDLVRINSLYRDPTGEQGPNQVLVNFFFPLMDEDMNIRPMADPYALLNGRIQEREPGLLQGKWFSSSGAADSFARVPCWIDIRLPQMKVITHVGISEDPALPRAEDISVDVKIKGHERRDMSEFEKKQAARGFWHNAVKLVGNVNTYSVFKLEQPVYTDHVRVYVLSGNPSITEIELYGAVPKPTEKPAEKSAGTNNP